MSLAAQEIDRGEAALANKVPSIMVFVLWLSDERGRINDVSKSSKGIFNARRGLLTTSANSNWARDCIA